MTYSEALEHATPDMILHNYAKNLTLEKLAMVRRFYKRNHGVPRGVINAVLLYTLVVRDGNLPWGEKYLIKVLNDFKNKHLTKTNIVVDYFDIYKTIKKNSIPDAVELEQLRNMKIDDKTSEALDSLYNLV